MAYGTVKVDNITFDDGGSDQNVTVSGLYNSLTSGITVTGTISGAVVIGSTSVSGTTVAGVTVTGTTVQGASGTFTSLTGTTTQGTTATYTTGSFTSLTGTTTTGTTSSFTSGVFTTLSGATATFTSGIIASGTAAAPSLAILGDPDTGVFSPGANQLAVATNGTGRLFVDSAGLVGIGTSAPASLFHLNASASGGGAIFSNQGYNCATVSQVVSSVDAIFGGGVIASDVAQEVKKINADPAHYVKIQTGEGISFHTNITGASGTSVNRTTNERLRITSAGLVGIGNTVPSNFNADLNTLVVGSGSGSQGMTIFAGVSSTSNIGFHDTANTSLSGMIRYDHSSDAMSFWTNGVNERARIDSSGRLLVGTSTARTINASHTGQIQLEGTNFASSTMSIIANSNDAAGSYLFFGKSRGTTIGSNTIVQNEDVLGQIDFFGSDGVGDFSAGARMAAIVDGTPGSGDLPTRLVFSTTSDSASSPTERLRITSAGLVGIGTSSPLSSLHVSTSNGNAVGLLLANTAVASQMQFSSSGGGGDVFIGCKSNGFAIQTSGSSFSDKLFIDSVGNVGIGTTSPGALLTTQAAPVSVAWYTSALFTGGANGDNAGSVVYIRPVANSYGGAIYGGRWSSTDRGIRVVGINQGGQERSYVHVNGEGDTVEFATATAERARIDSSGRLLVGTSTARANFLNATETAKLQIEGAVNISAVRTDDTAYPSWLILGKTRSTGNTIVQSGDIIGRVAFEGNDGSEFVDAAFISAEVDGTPGANDMPGRLVFSTTADGASSPTERMRITSGGNVGIGTNTPLYSLESGSSDDIQIALLRNSVGRWLLGTTSANNLKFDKEGGAEAMRFDASSRVLVGITSANASGAKLQTADGLTFPATQVASADPNTLDDYEEGTWTPSYKADTTDPTVAYENINGGKYTKIGRIVHIQATIQSTIISSAGSGDLFIGGLPFTPQTASVGGYSSTSIGLNTVIDLAANERVAVFLDGGAAKFRIIAQNDDTASNTTLTGAALASNASARYLFFSGSYLVA